MLRTKQLTLKKFLLSGFALLSLPLFLIAQDFKSTSFRLSNAIGIENNNEKAIYFNLNGFVSRVETATYHRSHGGPKNQEFTLVQKPNSMKVSGTFREKEGDDIANFITQYLYGDGTNAVIRTDTVYKAECPRATCQVFRIPTESSKKGSFYEIITKEGHTKNIKVDSQEIDPDLFEIRKVTFQYEGLLITIEPGKNALMDIRDGRIADAKVPAVRIFTCSKSQGPFQKGDKEYFETKLTLKRAP